MSRIEVRPQMTLSAKQLMNIPGKLPVSDDGIGVSSDRCLNDGLWKSLRDWKRQETGHGLTLA